MKKFTFKQKIQSWCLFGIIIPLDNSIQAAKDRWHCLWHGHILNESFKCRRCDWIKDAALFSRAIWSWPFFFQKNLMGYEQKDLDDEIAQADKFRDENFKAN